MTRDLLAAPALLVTGLLAAYSGSSRAERATPEDDVATTAFVGVTVLPMDSDRLLPDQTVVVRSGRITEVGPSARVPLQATVRRIEGHGRFLIPGLADMHAHLLEEDAYTPLFLAAGVTTLRVMGTSPEMLLTREEVKRGSRLGPTLILVGPLVDGDPPVWEGSAVVTTAEQAHRTVDEQKRAGYDLVKVYDNLEPAPYEAVIEEARRVGIPVVGHVPFPVGLDRVLAAHQRSIEHLNGYFEWLQRPDSPMRNRERPTYAGHGLFPPPKLSNYLDESRIPQIAVATARAGSWVVPTQVITRNMLPPKEAAEAMKRPMVRYITPMLRKWWTPGIRHVSSADWAAKRKGDTVQLQLVRALHDAGAKLLAGTDTPHPFVIPGFSVHDEVQNFVEAGLTPYEALATATRNAAEFMSTPGEFGVISPGARADLVLLEANPIQDVRNLGRVAGVMVRGRWLSHEELQRGLDALEAAPSKDAPAAHSHSSSH